MFLSESFSMSEMEICQILSLNYYRKLKEWWTDEADRDVLVLTCIETQNLQQFCYTDGEEISEKKSTSRFIALFLFRTFNSD